MLKNMLNLTGVLAIFSLVLFTSCNKDATEELTTEAFTETSLSAIQRDASAGPDGCFEFVFPITVSFEDVTSASVNDYEELKATILAWKEANPDATERPQLEFPLEVMSEDGELISVTSKEELLALKKTCGKGKKGKGKCKKPCIKLVFPISIEFPDGATAETADRAELKSLVRAWKEANPDATERPAFVFPIQVILIEDGTTVEVNDREELKTLKGSCKEEI